VFELLIQDRALLTAEASANFREPQPVGSDRWRKALKRVSIVYIPEQVLNALQGTPHGRVGIAGGRGKIDAVAERLSVLAKVVQLMLREVLHPVRVRSGFFPCPPKKYGNHVAWMKLGSARLQEGASTGGLAKHGCEGVRLRNGQPRAHATAHLIAPSIEECKEVSFSAAYLARHPLIDHDICVAKFSNDGPQFTSPSGDIASPWPKHDRFERAQRDAQSS
jgi:hypothetical protein